MARRVFFSFHYERDIWRANVVRNSGSIEGLSVSGFQDAPLWENIKKKGDAAVKELIDSILAGTVVTVVLIGEHTAEQRYVSYEIDQSTVHGNGILGIRVNNIKDQDGNTANPGPIPPALIRLGVPIYEWEYGRLAEWVENAYLKVKSSRRR